MPSMPYAGGGSFGSAAPKEPKVPLFCVPPPRDHRQDPDQNGTAPSQEKYNPCLPETTESNQFRAGRPTGAALPVLSGSKPCVRGLPAGLRKGYFKGQCVLPSSCLPQRLGFIRGVGMAPQERLARRAETLKSIIAAAMRLPYPPFSYTFPPPIPQKGRRPPDCCPEGVLRGCASEITGLRPGSRRRYPGPVRPPGRSACPGRCSGQGPGPDRP